jgi:hypothetical protein
MKRTQLLVLSALVAGLQLTVAQASPFPADAEASYDLQALETHADRQARNGNGGERMVVANFPADAEASHDLPAMESYAERQARTGGDVWGVSPRQPHDPFPFNSGYITD